MLRRLAKQVLELYARRLPYHRGKWRVIEKALKFSGIAEAERGETFDVERAGLQWRLNTECVVQRRLYYHGGFDVYDVRELISRVPADGVFFDIGAYFGYYALLAAQRGAEVFAFEPAAQNFALLQQNITLNAFKNVHPFQLALSDVPGRAKFAAAPPENRGTGRIATAAEHGEEVALTTLDAFTEQHKITRLHAVKIDVEGTEMQVLHGGRATIERFRPALLVELNPACLQRFGASEAELIEQLRGLKYEMFRATARGLRPFTARGAGEDYVNILALPKS